MRLIAVALDHDCGSVMPHGFGIPKRNPTCVKRWPKCKQKVSLMRCPVLLRLYHLVNLIKFI